MRRAQIFTDVTLAVEESCRPALPASVTLASLAVGSGRSIRGSMARRSS